MGTPRKRHMAEASMSGRMTQRTPSGEMKTAEPTAPVRGKPTRLQPERRVWKPKGVSSEQRPGQEPPRANENGGTSERQKEHMSLENMGR